ncbi:hypothetical protein QR680_015086 [Steinernema hermaphroditum]|uniref:Uncharacterized protein n=1 Tax=Steinernema hermaphroditum TaxID=289476 RepID=A0AA39M4Z5_9BILA|nr:hypothetical protein QR680_015086 [Steinernema hermaphroditum]
MLVWSSLRMNFSSKHRRLAIWKDPVFIVLRTGSQRRVNTQTPLKAKIDSRHQIIVPASRQQEQSTLRHRHFLRLLHHLCASPPIISSPVFVRPMHFPSHHLSFIKTNCPCGLSWPLISSTLSSRSRVGTSLDEIKIAPDAEKHVLNFDVGAIGPVGGREQTTERDNGAWKVRGKCNPRP